MLFAATILLLIGYLVAQFGIRAMKDPNNAPDRAGGYRVFAGTALAVCGLGMSLLELVARIF